MARIPTKFVVVSGDRACGKSFLFPFDEIEFESAEGLPCRLVIQETPDASAFDQLRPLSYKQADVVVLCFAIDSPDSLRGLVDKWYPEVEEYCPQVPVIVAGTKCDIRDVPATVAGLSAVQNRLLVSRRDAEMTAKMFNAIAYVECSGTTRKGVQDLLDLIAQIPPVETTSPGTEIVNEKSKKHKCTVM